MVIWHRTWTIGKRGPIRWLGRRDPTYRLHFFFVAPFSAFEIYSDLWGLDFYSPSPSSTTDREIGRWDKRAVCTPCRKQTADDGECENTTSSAVHDESFALGLMGVVHSTYKYTYIYTLYIPTASIACVSCRTIITIVSLFFFFCSSVLLLLLFKTVPFTQCFALVFFSFPLPPPPTLSVGPVPRRAGGIKK